MKKRNKRILSLLLVIVMSLGMTFNVCASETNDVTIQEKKRAGINFALDGGSVGLSPNGGEV